MIRVSSATILHETGTGELRAFAFQARHLGPVYSQQTPLSVLQCIVVDHRLLSHLFSRNDGLKIDELGEGLLVPVEKTP